MTPPVDWTERGRELGVDLQSCHAVVIVGSDSISTAEVALGVARSQARHRRVAVADLYGEAPPLQELVTSDDPHGIVDSFLFGVSLNRVAQYISEAGELFILPSGAAPIDYDEMFTHPRWRRLVAGFREVNALLLIVAPANAPSLRALVDATDGAVIVGDSVPADVSVAQSLAWLRSRRSAPVAVASVAEAEPALKEAPVAGAPVQRGQRIAAGAAGLLLTAGFMAAAYWFAERPFASPSSGKGTGLRGRSAPSTAALTLTADSAARRAADRVEHAPVAPVVADSFPALLPVNAADSAVASAFSVRLEQTNTKSGAILDLRGRFETVPAATYGFDLRTRFFLLVAGAYPTRAGADSLLARLRSQKVLSPDVGSVVVLPYAFLVESDVPMADVPARLARFAARGQPVYALRQPSGVAHLYFGAFESPQHAALAVPSVRDAGATPTLVYRIGRVF